jgi:hypothetical protein
LSATPGRAGAAPVSGRPAPGRTMQARSAQSFLTNASTSGRIVLGPSGSKQFTCQTW